MPEELMNARTLMYQAKFKEALEMLSGFEEKIGKSSKSHLLGLNLKGKVFTYRDEYKKAIKVGEDAYQLSLKLGYISESIDSLLLKAFISYFGQFEEAFNIILKAEQALNGITDFSNYDFLKKQAEIFLIKSIISHHKGDLNEAVGLAKQCSSIMEKYGQKLDIARIYYHLGELYLYKSESEIGLEYAKKALALQEELNNNVGIAKCQYLVGTSYYTKGDVDQALEVVKKGLAIKEISNLAKLESIDILSGIYINKGELDRALRYRIRGAKLAEEEEFNEEVIISIYGIGVIYRIKGEFDLATNYLKRSLELSEKFNSTYGMQASLFYLILTYLDINSLKQAKEYLVQLKKLAEKTESQVFSNIFKVAKALVLKKTGRIRNHTKAELLLKEIIEDKFSTPVLYLLSLVNLCDLFLEELFITNNPEVLDELNPLISKMAKFAENQRAYLWLAETRLIQAKLALIQMKIEDAKQILTQAQRVAELHGLSLLAIKISTEHDNLLEQLNIWDNLKNTDAPMSDRIKLASLDEPIERMQGKRAIERLKTDPEIPVLLLIIGKGGFPLFSNQFLDNYNFEEDLISAFLAAFNNFSDEIFSKGLDRAKFGDNMILMQSLGSFSVCYLFKGQTYLAKQKLTQFTERIHNTSVIWEILNDFYNTNRIVEFKDLPSLKLLISEVFAV
ncbi:MAG: tetratricopeptide repeat protein [Promethearchaeota archaeon]|jgi:tetratricopeptide (TPR) repeat protein